MSDGGQNKPVIKSLMLIDDDIVDQKLCERLVTRSGLVDTFNGFLSAEDALAHILQQKQPAADAILLDINMPRMNGFEFLDAATAQLGDSFARMVVIMLTTSLNPSDQKRARSYSVVKHYCNKPLLLRDLSQLADMLGPQD